MNDLRKTIYVPQDLIEELGECRSFSHRAIDLIRKGLLYEQSGAGKVTMEMALGYFNNIYRKKNPNKPLP